MLNRDELLRFVADIPKAPERKENDIRKAQEREITWIKRPSNIPIKNLAINDQQNIAKTSCDQEPIAIAFCIKISPCIGKIGVLADKPIASTNQQTIKDIAPQTTRDVEHWHFTTDINGKTHKQRFMRPIDKRGLISKNVDIPTTDQRNAIPVYGIGSVNKKTGLPRGATFDAEHPKRTRKRKYIRYALLASTNLNMMAARCHVNGMSTGVWKLSYQRNWIDGKPVERYIASFEYVQAKAGLSEKPTNLHMTKDGWIEENKWHRVDTFNRQQAITWMKQMGFTDADTFIQHLSTCLPG